MHELDDFKVGQTYHQMHELDSCKVGHHQQTNLLFHGLYDAHFEIHLQQYSSIRLQEGKWLLVGILTRVVLTLGDMRLSPSFHYVRNILQKALPNPYMVKLNCIAVRFHPV